ncbi:hypothetical protein JCM9492_10960 [Aquifex pyrophilus]
MTYANGKFVFGGKEVEPAKLQDLWQFLYDSYTGLGGYEDGSYLVKHKREPQEKYERRKKLAYYPNYVKKIVDTYTAQIFKTPPERELTPEYELFVNDADRKGTYIDDFMRRAFKLALIFGTAFIVVDKPSETARTKQEEIEKKLLPYATIRLPWQVESYELDEYGNLVRIVFKEGKKRKREYSLESFKVYEGKRLVLERENPLGVLPIAVLRTSDQLLYEELFSEPFIYTIAMLNFELYNLISEIREILRNITFPILTYPSRSPEFLANASIEIGTENALIYNPEGGGRPDFIAPPPAPVEVYMEYMNLVIEQIYRTANLEFTLGSQSQRSGVALEFEFQNLNTLLSMFAMNLEKTEYEIANIVSRWHGKESFDGRINYRKDFSFRDVERELKIALDSLTAGIQSATFTAEVQKKIAKLVLKDEVEDEVMERIYTEIEGLEGIDNQLKNELKL